MVDRDAAKEDYGSSQQLNGMDAEGGSRTRIACIPFHFSIISIRSVTSVLRFALHYSTVCPGITHFCVTWCVTDWGAHSPPIAQILHIGGSQGAKPPALVPV